MKPLKLRSKINIFILLSCLLVTPLYGFILWSFETHRMENAVSKVKLLMQATIKQKYEDLANEIAYKSTDALDFTFRDMMRVNGVIAVGACDTSGEPILASEECDFTLDAASKKKDLPQNPSFSESETPYGRRVLTYVTPIRVVGETVGFTSMSFDLDEIRKETRFALLLFSFLLLVILLLVSLVLQALLTRFVSRPVLVLRDAMNRVREGDMVEPVQLDSNDEIGEMANAFNEMSTKLRSSLEQLRSSKEKLEDEVGERARAEERLSRINECFLEFGPDPKENISRLTALCGALQGATYAVYNRLEGNALQAVGTWSAGQGLLVQGLPETCICRDVIEMDSDEAIIVRQLQRSRYVQQNPHGMLGHLHTYLGKAVKCGKSCVGSLCVLFEDDIAPGEEDKKLMEIVAAAIGVEEDRLKAEEERKKLEAQTLRTQKLESLGVLAGGIAHDFNNLLMGILGNAEMMLINLPETSSQVRFVKAIQKAGLRAADLTNQMLAYSGKGRFFVEQFNINALIEEMADLLQVSISKKVTMRCDFAGSLPPIEADATQVRQIVMNLITNASEAIGDSVGSIVLCTGVEELDPGEVVDNYLDEMVKPGRYVYLEVSDSGCGMDQETRLRIFDPFFTTKFTGRGLGLAAVLGIVRSHEGMIRVHSEPNKGSTFRVLLPSANPSSPPEPAESSPPPCEFVSSATVLVIDDEEPVRNVAQMMLEGLGFKVLTAKDGQEGLDVFLESPETIDAVLLDMTMPMMSGEETLRGMKAVRPDIPVILMSGYDESEAVIQFEAGDLAGFIQKPFTAMTLGERLRTALASEE